MHPAEEELDSHTIELAATRPAMWRIPFLGEVPIPAACIIVGCACLMYIGLGWKYFLWFPFAWYGTARAITLNYHAIGYFQKYLMTCQWVLTKKQQGGYSATPFPINTNRPRGMI